MAYSWPSKYQLAEFKTRRKAGLITVFRMRICEACQQQIPADYNVCSLECVPELIFTSKRTSDKEGNMPMPIRWIIDLSPLLSGRHTIETNTGTIRDGRITKVNMRTKLINGRTVSEPESIELNDESSDFIPWEHVTSIKAV